MENENWAERKGRVGLSGMTAGIADLWPDNIRRRKFGEVSCTECAVQVVSEFPSICNHCGVTAIWSRRTLKILKKFLRIFGKATHYGKIFKFCSEGFHRDTDQRVVFKFREIWSTWNRWNHTLLSRTLVPDKKLRLALQLSISLGSCAKSARTRLTSPRQCTQSAPDFIQIGSLSAEL